MQGRKTKKQEQQKTQLLNQAETHSITSNLEVIESDCMIQEEEHLMVPFLLHSQTLPRPLTSNPP